MQTFWSKIWKEEKWLLDLECQKKKQEVEGQQWQDITMEELQ